MFYHKKNQLRRNAQFRAQLQFEQTTVSVNAHKDSSAPTGGAMRPDPAATAKQAFTVTGKTTSEQPSCTESSASISAESRAVSSPVLSTVSSPVSRPVSSTVSSTATSTAVRTKSYALAALSMACGLVLAGCNFDGKDGQTGLVGPVGANGSNGVSAVIGMDLIPIARHVSGSYGAGAAEITQYHSASKRIYVVNGAANAIDILDASGLKNQALTDARVAMTLNSNKFAIPSSIKTTDGSTVELGMANSIAIHGDTLAVAVENKRKSAAGVVLFYDIKAAAPLFIKALRVGALPDMLTFSADGSRVLVANEAEPETDYSADPEGSVAIISIDKGVIADQALLVGFSDFNSKQAELSKQGVKFAGPAGTTVAQDLEPEYITLAHDGKKAYVALQENNALAVLDIGTGKFEKIVALGGKDHSVHALDVSDRDGVLLQKVPGLFGLYQPDTIASYQWQGATFIVSANEGDARDWKGFSEETRVGSIKRSAALVEKQQAGYQKDGLGRLKITKAMGLNSNGEYDALYAFGGRSFSIWDAQGRQVFDSGDQLEKISAAVHGELAFNSNHLSNTADNRSDDKGPEPEALALGQIGGQTFAFVGTERQSGIYIFDITNPFATQFVNYSHNRDFNQTFNIDDEKVPAVLTGAYAQAGDLGPESMLFVSAAQSPIAQPLLLVANEVSGSLTVYMVQPKRAQ